MRSRRRQLFQDAFRRFRYGDGFSHARALGLQLSLTSVPLIIATVGLSGALYAERLGVVVRHTVLSITPGASDPMMRTTLEHPQEADVSELALWAGLAVSVIAMTTAMGQIERGANRIYGIQRDRPTIRKYSRAFGMALIAGFPAVFGYSILLAGPSFGEAVEQEFGREDDVVSTIMLPVGAALLLFSVAMMLRLSPRRRQPRWPTLVLGAATSLLLWLAFTGILAIYLFYSDDFGSVYGPLTAVMVLLLWSQLIGIGIFFGFAIAAQTEAECAGVQDISSLHADNHDPCLSHRKAPRSRLHIRRDRVVGRSQKDHRRN